MIKVKRKAHNEMTDAALLLGASHANWEYPKRINQRKGKSLQCKIEKLIYVVRAQAILHEHIYAKRMVRFSEGELDLTNKVISEITLRTKCVLGINSVTLQSLLV